MGKSKKAQDKIDKSSTAGGAGNKKKIAGAQEIDQLFSSVQKKPLVVIPEETPSENTKEKIKVKHRSANESTYGIMKSENGNDIVNPEAPLERIDKESGLPVYKAHLLKVGEGGGTPLCPFDCNCCF